MGLSTNNFNDSTLTLMFSGNLDADGSQNALPMLDNVIAQAKAEAKNKVQEEAKRLAKEKIDEKKDELVDKAKDKLKSLLDK